MKTDDYKQELSISATLHYHKSKKIFLRSKNQQIAAQALLFFQSCRGRSQSIGAPKSPEKTAPRLKGRIDRITTLL